MRTAKEISRLGWHAMFCFVSAIWPVASIPNAHADSLSQFVRKTNFVRDLSNSEIQGIIHALDEGFINGGQALFQIRQVEIKEDQSLDGVWAASLKQAKDSDLGPLGGSMYADLYPSSNVPIGQMDLLTFSFISPETGLPTSGPQIGSVVYDVNLDPSDPDLFQTIGTSFDAAHDFALPFTAAGFEPLIRATPRLMLAVIQSESKA